MARFVFLVIVVISSFCFAQKPAYILYSSTGKKVKYKKVVKSLLETDIVLFGEIHNNPIAHWLTIELAKDLNKKRPINLGLEMFEKHQQALLNRYFESEISEEVFVRDKTQWSNFETDYFPLVKWAKQEKLKVFSTNITREYATLVFKQGIEVLEALSREEKENIAPLPMPFNGELPQYKNLLTMMGNHGGENLVKAQAIKDATMAHSILKNREKEKLFFHVNGSYHSDFHEGIGWYLKQYDSEVSFKTISVVEQKSIDTLEKEHLGKADFIICVPESMTKTY